MKRQIKTIMLLIAGLSTLSSVNSQDELHLSYEEVAADTVAVAEASPVAEELILEEEGVAVAEPAAVAGSRASSKKAKSPKTYCPHEIGIWLSGGSGNLFYSSSFGEQSPGWGGAFGLGYTWFFHRNWGIGLGAELALYQGQIRIDGLTDTYFTQDADGDDVWYSARFDNYKEVQYLGNVNIPLNFIFQTKMRGENRFYASLAFKLGVPLWSQYGSKSAELTTWGDYPHMNQTLRQQQDLGYGNFKGINSKGKIPFDLAYMGQAEVGFKWHLAPGRDLYTGIYGEYAFNDVVKGSPSDRFITYNSEKPSDFRTSSVLTSEYRRYDASSVFTDKVALLGVGVKVKLGLSAGCSAQLEAERAAKEAQKAAEKQAKKDEKRQERMDDLQYLQAQQQTLGNNGGGNASVEAARYYAEAARASAEQARIEAERAREERDAYLREASKRREDFERDVVRNSRLRDVDNYNLAVVTLNAVQKRDLDDYIELVQSDEHMTIKITGHTCDIGSEELNRRIGQERADLAKDYMVENGISPKRITTLSKGETEPVFPNNNPVNRKKNRRLEMEVIR
jgi:outer membrane protein OmpA-like peptidoglycan-associated protein